MDCKTEAAGGIFHPRQLGIICDTVFQNYQAQTARQRPALRQRDFRASLRKVVDAAVEREIITDLESAVAVNEFSIRAGSLARRSGCARARNVGAGIDFALDRTGHFVIPPSW